MKYLEPVATSLSNAVRARFRPGEKELIRVASDLTHEGTFGTQWVIVTDQRVLVASAEDRAGTKEILLQDVTSARTDALVTS